MRSDEKDAWAEPEDALAVEVSHLGESPTARERRLSTRQKATRTALPVLAVVLAAVVLLGGPGALLARLPAPPPSPHTAASLPSGPQFSLVHTPARVPQSAALHKSLQISATPEVPGTAFACWSEQAGFGQPVSADTLRLAVTHDGGQAWQTLAPPLPHAAECQVVPDSAGTPAVLVAAYRLFAGPGDCRPLPTLLLSGDGGGRWAPVPWSVALANVCGLRLALLGGTVYAWADDPLLPGLPAGQGWLIASADGGQTWRRADYGLEGYRALTLVALRPGGWLLAQAARTAAPGHWDLLETRDGGLRWAVRGALPDAPVHVAASNDPTQRTLGGWGALFALAGAPSAQRVLTPTADGQWTPLPPLPSLGTMGRGTLSLEAVLQERRLLVAETLATGLSGVSPLAPVRRLWLWDGVRGEWLRGDHLLPANTFIDGVSWQGGQPTLWLARIPPGVLVGLEIETVTLAPLLREGMG